MAVAHDKPKYTIEDYMRLPEGERVELIGGDLLVSPSPRTKHQQISWNLTFILERWIREKHRGMAFAAPMDVVLSRHDVVQPDLLFISKGRSSIITEANIQGAPDLVVEILSPGAEKRDQLLKMALYERHRVREYWIVDPEAETISVYSLNAEKLALKQVYGRRDVLRSAAFPDFSVSPAEVFETIT